MGIRLLTPIPGLLLGNLLIEDLTGLALEDFNQPLGRFYQVIDHHARCIKRRVRVKQEFDPCPRQPVMERWTVRRFDNQSVLSNRVTVSLKGKADKIAGCGSEHSGHQM
jgi:hypothetical protein